jgi:hypothetical protein
MQFPSTRSRARATFAPVSEYFAFGNRANSNPGIVLPSIASLRAEAKRRQYLGDVSLWAKERLGVDLWSKQREIAASVKAPEQNKRREKE